MIQCGFCGDVSHPSERHECKTCGRFGIHRTGFCPQSKKELVCGFCGDNEHSTFEHKCKKCRETGVHRSGYCNKKRKSVDQTDKDKNKRSSDKEKNRKSSDKLKKSGSGRKKRIDIKRSLSQPKITTTCKRKNSIVKLSNLANTPSSQSYNPHIQNKLEYENDKTINTNAKRDRSISDPIVKDKNRTSYGYSPPSTSPLSTSPPIRPISPKPRYPPSDYDSNVNNNDIDTLVINNDDTEVMVEPFDIEIDTEIDKMDKGETLSHSESSNDYIASESNSYINNSVEKDDIQNNKYKFKPKDKRRYCKGPDTIDCKKILSQIDSCLSKYHDDLSYSEDYSKWYKSESDSKSESNSEYQKYIKNDITVYEKKIIENEIVNISMIDELLHNLLKQPMTPEIQKKYFQNIFKHTCYFINIYFQFVMKYTLVNNNIELVCPNIKTYDLPVNNINNINNINNVNNVNIDLMKKYSTNHALDYGINMIDGDIDVEDILLVLPISNLVLGGGVQEGNRNIEAEYCRRTELYFYLKFVNDYLQSYPISGGVYFNKIGIVKNSNYRIMDKIKYISILCLPIDKSNKFIKNRVELIFTVMEQWNKKHLILTALNNFGDDKLIFANKIDLQLKSHKQNINNSNISYVHFCI